MSHRASHHLPAPVSSSPRPILQAGIYRRAEHIRCWFEDQQDPPEERAHQHCCVHAAGETRPQPVPPAAPGGWEQSRL